MIKIRVPATSANLGPGFDTLGIALSLYDDFYFEQSLEWEFEDFPDQYSVLSRNIVAQSAIHFYRTKGIKTIPLSIRYKGNIPNKRGLGSSASCIVAGVMAANYFTGDKLTKEEIFNIAAKIEGHPDNVSAAIFGGFTSVISGVEKVIKHEVHNSLVFIVAIPKNYISTMIGRRTLPRVQDYKKITHNVSRAINIPLAMKNGDLELLKVLFDDVIHEPYRMPLIKSATDIKKIINDNGLPICISGSGSSLLIISKNAEIIKKISFFDWQFLKLDIDKEGARYE